MKIHANTGRNHWARSPRKSCPKSKSAGIGESWWLTPKQGVQHENIPGFHANVVKLSKYVSMSNLFIQEKRLLRSIVQNMPWENRQMNHHRPRSVAKRSALIVDTKIHYHWTLPKTESETMFGPKKLTSEIWSRQSKVFCSRVWKTNLEKNRIIMASVPSVLPQRMSNFHPEGSARTGNKNNCVVTVAAAPVEKIKLSVCCS